MNKLDILVVTDADNTLWDTNAVYADGQLLLLEKIENDVGVKLEVEDRLAFIRAVDQELVRLNNYNLTYQPEFLYLAIFNMLNGYSLMEAVTKAMGHTIAEISDKKMRERVNWFIDFIINKKPELRSGVLTGIKQLSEMETNIVVFTEGNEKRCHSLIEFYGLKQFILKVYVEGKHTLIYKKIQKELGSNKAFMIGDQIDRDIQPAKEAGFFTIYFPGGFKPHWLPEKDESSANYIISSFEETPLIVKSCLSF